MEVKDEEVGSSLCAPLPKVYSALTETQTDVDPEVEQIVRSAVVGYLLVYL